jgi:hypothetical protein
MATGLAPLRFAKDLIRRSEGRARADHHRALPFPITLDELAGAVEASARSAGTAARTRTAGRVGHLGDHVALGASATET